MDNTHTHTHTRTLHRYNVRLHTDISNKHNICMEYGHTTQSPENCLRIKIKGYF